MGSHSGEANWWQKVALRFQNLDWLQVLGLIAIPISGVLIAGMTYYVTQEQGKAELESQNYAVMSSYYDQMRELAINGKLLDSPTENVKSLSKSITLSAFRQLDAGRRGEVLKSLYDMNLVGKCEFNIKTREADKCRTDSVVVLSGARLDGLKFNEAISLVGINLSDTWLLKANFKEVDLSRANLAFAKLNDSEMEKAELEKTNLAAALLQHTNLKGANLQGADLRKADFERADLQGADLRRACLQGADFTNAKLNRANLTDAEYDSQTTFPNGFDKKAHKLREVSSNIKLHSTQPSCL